MAERKHPTSVTTTEGDEKPMHMKVLRKEFGWEVQFHYDGTRKGTVEVYDAADDIIDSSEVEPGDDVSVLLNVADWDLTEDHIKDAIESVT